MSKREDIDHRLVYTCKCGWIDKGHAFAASNRPYVSPKHLWHQILFESGEKSKRKDQKGFKVTYRQDMGRSIFGKLITTGVTRHYFVKYGMSRKEKESVALAIFQEVSYAFESYQSYFFWSDSSFSVEDLVSNLIGFYKVVKPNIDYMTLCGAVSKNASLEVWDTYGPVGEIKNRSWGAFLYPCKECSGIAKAPICALLPKPLQSIVPAKKGTLFRDWDVFKDGGYNFPELRAL